MKTKMCYFLTATGLTIGTSSLKVVRSLHTWCFSPRPETFLKDVEVFGLNSGVMEWKLCGQQYMMFRWDGLMGFPSVFMLLEPRYLLRFLQSATPSQVYVPWSEYVVWWVAEPTNGSQWLIPLPLLPVWAHPLLSALTLIQSGPELICLTKPSGNYLVLIVFYSGCISPFFRFLWLNRLTEGPERLRNWCKVISQESKTKGEGQTCLLLASQNYCLGLPHFV